MDSKQFTDKQIITVSASAPVSRSQPSTDGASGELPDVNATGGVSTDGGGMIKEEEFLSDLSSNNIATLLTDFGFDSLSCPNVGFEIASSSSRAMKKHAEILLHALEDLSSRLSQLESRTHHLIDTMDELKVTVGNNNDSTIEKLRQFENILIKASEAQHKQPEVSNPGVSPQLSQLHIPSVPHLPRKSFPPAQEMERMQQRYQDAVRQPQQPPPPTHYQSAPQLPQNHQPHVNPEELAPNPPKPSSSWSILQTSPMYQPQSRPPQQFGPNMYEHPANKPTVMRPYFPSGYNSAMGTRISESSHYGSPPWHSSSVMKPPNYSSGAASFGGSGYHPRLPTAQFLPQALPTAPALPFEVDHFIDDLVERVVTMGFSKDQVRATVWKLKENGQSIDMNVVIDKLTNDAHE